MSELEEKKKSRSKSGGTKDGKGSKSKGYNLRDWFKGGGWVQAGGKYDGKPCAKQPGQKTKPYCRDPDDRSKMGKKEKEKRARKKRKEDPNPDRRGKAKNVSQKQENRKNEAMRMTSEEIRKIILEELEHVLSEKSRKKRKAARKRKKAKSTKKDACYRKVKSRYKVWPSAYGSGALVKCRKVGAKNWGNKSKKNEDLHEVEITDEEEQELEDVSKQLKGAVKAHGNQAKTIDKAIKNEEEMEEAKKKKPCKPSKGKRFAKRVDGKCRSFGQKGQAKGGGDRIRPGTKKGDAYCARSAKIKKCKNPPCANDLSRKKWKCRGSKSMKE